jgi:hypothetical protein
MAHGVPLKKGVEPFFPSPHPTRPHPSTVGNMDSLFRLQAIAAGIILLGSVLVAIVIVFLPKQQRGGVVVYTDFTSQYPTVDTLLGLWPVLTASKLRVAKRRGRSESPR